MNHDKLKDKIIQSSYVGIIEVFATHPIEYVKTQYQATNSWKKITYNNHSFVNSMYPRLATIIPMRTIFWSSLFYHKDNKSSVFWSSLSTSFIQTIVDFPSDQIKARQICSAQSKNNLKLSWSNICSYMRGKYIQHGYLMHNYRNFIFLYNYYLFKNKNDNILNNIFGSVCGVVLSHPFDTMKTLYHCEQPYLLKRNTNYEFIKMTKYLMNGVLMRAGNTTLSMVLGWSLFTYVF